MNKNILGGLVGIIIVGGGAFYAGDVYGKGAAAPAAGAARFAAGGMMGGVGGMRAGRGGGGFISGQIVSVDNGSVTVKLASGSTQIVLMGTSTQILKSASGSLGDLSAGTNVVATGSANSDGSLTAQSIQIRPAGLPGRPSGTAAATPTGQ